MNVKTKWMNVVFVNSCHRITAGKEGKTMSYIRLLGSMWIFISRIKSGSLIGIANRKLLILDYIPGILPCLGLEQ